MESHDQSDPGNSSISKLHIDSDESQPKSKNNEVSFKSWYEERYRDHDIQWPYSPTDSSPLATPSNNSIASSNSAAKNRPSDVPDRYLIDHRLSTKSNSTKRSSVASSILSRTLSTTSTALSRYSSVRSSRGIDPVFASPISPWGPCPGKDFEPPPSYNCTLCSAGFDSVDEWKSHELECHDRRAQYICTECHVVYAEISLLAAHRQDAHNFRTTPPETGVNTVWDRAKRSAWGCGFCAMYLSSQHEYLDHVGGHYDEGRSISEWRHSFVIKGLLHQPVVHGAWQTLVAKMEPGAEREGTFFWDSRITGRSPPSVGDASTPSLQDLLECFAESHMHPKAIAKAAYDLACTTALDHTDDDVHDVSMRINVVSPMLSSTDITTTTASTRPEDRSVFQTISPEIRHGSKSSSASDTRSNAPSCGRPAKSSYTLPLPISVRENDQGTPSKIFVNIEASPAISCLTGASGTSNIQGVLPTSSPRFQPRHLASGLRRIDSERDLEVLKGPGKMVTSKKEELTPAFSDRLGATPKFPSTLPGRTALLPAVPESTTEGRMDRPACSELNEISSLRSHSNSSVLSARTVESLVSNDSVSEPDIWLEFDGKSTASKEWSRRYQRVTDKVMESLWSQYNEDWDAMIRSRAGGSGHNNPRGRESQSARRTQTSGSSHHTSGRGLRPTNRYPINDEDDEDERNGYPPNTFPAKLGPAGPKRFACPFRKHDPGTFNLKDHQICVVNAWPTIPRLKEHLYRRHHKIHCPRCKQTFADAQGLATHEMAFEGCTVLDVAPPGHITAAQEKRLKSRKSTTRHLKEEEKWSEIYQLLFPHDHVVPSPYPEYSEDLGPISPESGSSLNFQHYLLTQMPGLFRQAAEDHLGRHIQSQEALMMEDIPAIIQDSLQKAFNQWEGSGGSGAFSSSIQSPGSLGSFVTHPASVVSPSSPHPPPWSSGDLNHMSSNPYASVALEPTTSWVGMSQSLEPMALTSGEPTWLSSSTTTTGLESYDPYFMPASGMSNGFGGYIPTTSGVHGGTYASHDAQMGGDTNGGPGYFQ